MPGEQDAGQPGRNGAEARRGAGIAALLPAAGVLGPPDAGKRRALAVAR